MQLSQQTVLITGGATGIGLAIAARFLQAGSVVIAAGRREEALAAAREELDAVFAQMNAGAGRL